MRKLSNTSDTITRMTINRKQNLVIDISTFHVGSILGRLLEAILILSGAKSSYSAQKSHRKSQHTENRSIGTISGGNTVNSQPNMWIGT